MKVLLVTLLLGACTGGAADPTGPDGGSPTGSPDGTPGGTATGIHPIVTTAAEAADSLFPIAVGLAWTYDIDAGTTTCTPGARTIEIRSKETVGGVTIYAMDTPCDYFGPGANQVRVVGEDVYSQVATGAESKVLAIPLMHGATWAMNGAVTADWIREDSPVTVPAGTFDDCWTVHALPWESWSTYCRGVGLVRSRSDDDVSSGSTGFGLELTSYDFSAL